MWTVLPQSYSIPNPNPSNQTFEPHFRRAALKWILQNTQPTDPGIVYFADDDNTYDVDLFAELRKTRRISMFPVGLIHPSGVSSPVLNDRGRVTGKEGKEP